MPIINIEIGNGSNAPYQYSVQFRYFLTIHFTQLSLDFIIGIEFLNYIPTLSSSIKYLLFIPFF